MNKKIQERRIQILFLSAFGLVSPVFRLIPSLSSLSYTLRNRNLLVCQSCEIVSSRRVDPGLPLAGSPWSWPCVVEMASCCCISIRSSVTCRTIKGRSRSRGDDPDVSSTHAPPDTRIVERRLIGSLLVTSGGQVDVLGSTELEKLSLEAE